MLDRTLGDYGAPYRDALPVEDPQTQMSSDAVNLAFSDIAQASRTVLRAIVTFKALALPDIPALDAASVWGFDAASWPTISRTAPGRYTVKYALALPDELGALEPVAFHFGHVSVQGPKMAFAQITSLAANAIDVLACDFDGNPTDFGSDHVITLWLR